MDGNYGFALDQLKTHHPQIMAPWYAETFMLKKFKKPLWRRGFLASVWLRPPHASLPREADYTKGSSSFIADDEGHREEFKLALLPLWLV